MREAESRVAFFNSKCPSKATHGFAFVLVAILAVLFAHLALAQSSLNFLIAGTTKLVDQRLLDPKNVGNDTSLKEYQDYEMATVLAKSTSLILFASKPIGSIIQPKDSPKIRQYGCTAFVVDKRTFLTQGHCVKEYISVDDGDSKMVLAIYFSKTPWQTRGDGAVSSFVKISKENISTTDEVSAALGIEDIPDKDDLALIRLSSDIPEWMSPIGICWDCSLGDLTIAGYGKNSFEDTDVARLRFADFKVVKALKGIIEVSSGVAAICHGDSGGVGVVRTPRGLMVVGSVARHSNCVSYGGGDRLTDLRENRKRLKSMYDSLPHVSGLQSPF